MTRTSQRASGASRAPTENGAVPDKKLPTSGFGPALVLALAAIGPFDLVTNATAGASYGYSLLWTLTLVFLARYVTLEASARYVLATGQSLVSGFAGVGKWTLWVVLLAALLKLHVGNLSLILLLGSASDSLFLLPYPGSPVFWAALFWALGFALMFWGGYPLVERCAKPFLAMLGLSIGAIAVLSRPDLVEAARGAVVPTFPPDQGLYRYGLVVMAVIGSSAGSLSNLAYAGFLHEKGWRRTAFLRQQRRDLLAGVGSMWAVAMMIQVAAAASLNVAGVELRSPGDLIGVASQVLGPVGRWAAAVGIWAAVFTTYIGANTGYSMMMADIWRQLRSSDSDSAPGSSTNRASGYRWVLAVLCLPPVYVLLTHWRALPLTLLSTALFVVVLPISVALLLRLTADRRIMGSMANGWFSNLVLGTVLLAAAFLTWQNGAVFLNELQEAL